MPEPVSATPLIRTENLCKYYPDGDVQALRGIDLTIHRNEYTAIMGPSGSGKSTLLSMIGALDRPTSGEVYFDGQPLSGMQNLDHLRARQIGFVFQSFLLIPTLSALENVQVPMFESPRRGRERTEHARQLLAAVGLTQRERHLPAQLSVGERQRVAIARALANDPALLLADEPTGNLDSHNERLVLDLFEEIQARRNLTLITVTHSQAVAPRARHVVTLSDGRLEDSSRLTG